MKDTQAVTEMERAEEFSRTDNRRMSDSSDKYSDSIDLSNKCREFYQARKKAAEAVKEKLSVCSSRQRTSRRTTIDTAMETLRTEMSSLMDQDLSLMKQLLTLNEAIEDLKWQKRYYHSQTSMPASSCDLSESDWSVSETDMYDSENEAPRKYPTPSALSLQSRLSGKQDDLETKTTVLADSPITVDCTTDNSKHTESTAITAPARTDSQQFISAEIYMNCLAQRVCHEEQHSFDSGIHEPVLRKEITV